MKIPALTLCNRALLLESRSWATVIIRALLLVFIGFILSEISDHSSSGGAIGLKFFAPISYSILIGITLYGFALFSTTITEEKEAQTLGLLKMAGISSLGILLGKSTSLLISALLLIACVIPFAMLSVTLGGVSTFQVMAVFILIVSHIIMIANVGLFFSVICSRSRQASSFTLGFILCYGLLPYFVTLLVMEMQYNNNSPSFLLQSVADINLFVQQTCAFNRLDVILTTGFQGSLFSTQTWFNCGIGIAFFIFSLLTFERFTRHEIPTDPKRTLLLFKKKIKKSRSGRATKNFLIWKDYNFILGGLFHSIIRCLLYLIICIIVIGYSSYQQMRYNSSFEIEWEDSGNALMVIFLIISIASIAGRLSKNFGSEKQWNTFSNLLMLPYSSYHLMLRKILCCFIATLPAVLFFFLSTLLNLEDFSDGLSDFFSEIYGWTLLFSVPLFWNLTIYLSLRIKRAPAVLALGIIVLSYMLLIFIALSSGGGGIEGFFVLHSVAAISISAVLHFKLIPERMNITALANS